MKKPAYVRRRSSRQALDDFPTPPWAVRALMKYVMPTDTLHGYVVREPACGRGHVVRVLQEYGAKVVGSDIKDYGFGYKVDDYPHGSYCEPDCDYVITNPPYKECLNFVERALSDARLGVAVLVRTLWAEGGREHDKSRYHLLFKNRPPSKIAIICGRMPATKGRVVRYKSVFMSHAWFYWDVTRLGQKGTSFVWIPPEAQRLLERPSDYKKEFLTKCPPVLPAKQEMLRPKPLSMKEIQKSINWAGY